MKSVRKNEAKRFYFALTLWPPDKVKVDQSKSQVAPTSMAGMKTFS